MTKTIIKSLVLALVWSNLVITAALTAPLAQLIVFVIIPSFIFSIYIVAGILSDLMPKPEDRFK